MSRYLFSLIVVQWNFLISILINFIPFLFRTFNGSVPEHRLRQLLQLLRIEANIHPMNEWATNDEFTMHGQILKHFTKQSDSSVDVLTEENINRSRMYMQK